MKYSMPPAPRLLCALPLLFLLHAARATEPAEVILAGEAFARQQTELTVAHILDNLWGATDSLFPFETYINHATEPDYSWRYAKWDAWPAGFFAGVLWHFAETTGEPLWETRARQFTGALSGWRTKGGDHDIGFNLLSSFGRGYDITGEDGDRAALVTGADTFITNHWMPEVGSLWSFNFNWSAKFRPEGSERVQGPIRQRQNVIIDTSMNIELLFQGARLGGDPELWNRGRSHMRNVVRDMVRPDGGTIQVVDYWLTDQYEGDELVAPEGSLRGAYAWQGYSNASTWSRGQGWAIHGLATAYRETGDAVILEGLLRAADYYLRETPPDGVPYWDYDVAAITDPGYLDFYAGRDLFARDSSAAAIAAAGLLQLSVLLDDPEERQRYFSAAETILVSLSTPVADGGFLALGTPYQSILAKGTYSFDGYDKGLAWGDFYYLQAIQRYREIVDPPARWSDDRVAGLAGRWGMAPAHAWTIRRHAGKPAMGISHGQYQAGLDGQPRAVAVLDTPLLGDFAFTVEVASAENLDVRPDATAMILFNWLGERDYHYILLGAQAGVSGLYRVEDGVESQLLAIPGPLLTDSAWRQVTLQRAGTDHTVSVDGAILLGFQAPAPASGGLVGLGADGHAAFFASAQLSGDLPPDSYADWAQAAIPDPAMRGPEADADGNGLANVLEYLLADEAALNGGAPGLTLALHGDATPEASFTSRFRPDYALVLEQSANLSDWAPVALPSPALLLPDAGGLRRTRHAAGHAQTRFFRLRAIAREQQN
jgi:unsaturated chondroitin disaccharide hydrolase